MSRLIKSSN